MKSTMWGCLLIVASSLPVEAQTPQSSSQTSNVEQLGLPDTDTPVVSAGTLRELRCRGKPGIDLRNHEEPSPRDAELVTMVLRYERPNRTNRAFSQDGMGMVDYGVSLSHLPGTCTWNPLGLPDIPPEPGVVYFDLPRDAQAWASPGDRDTSITAAVRFPDVTSLPRYLGDPDRYWVFYVNDVTNVSISFTAWPPRGGLPLSQDGSATPSSTEHDLSTSREAVTAMGTRTRSSSGDGLAGPISDASSQRIDVETATGSVAGSENRPSVGQEGAVDSSRATRMVPSSPGTPVTSQLGDERSPRQTRQASGIRDVSVAPGPSGVRLRFRTVPDRVLARPHVWVQFSREPPQWDAGERSWAYSAGPTGWGSPWFADIELVFVDTRYMYEATPYGLLEEGARYHYLITVVDDETSSPIAQRTGSFTAAVGP